MKNKDWNLSEKIWKEQRIDSLEREAIWASEIREFIKKLKEETYNKHYQDYPVEVITINDLDRIIDKLAGEELTSHKEKS